MPGHTISAFWIEDQLSTFIDSGWEVMTDVLDGKGITLVKADLDEVKTIKDVKIQFAKLNEINVKPPDLILLDLMLPLDEDDVKNKRVNLDAGYLLWYEIRFLKTWPTLVQIPIIIITGRGPDYMDLILKDKAFTRWISKPADPITIANTIYELIHNRDTI